MNKTKLITTRVVHFTSSTTVKKMAFLFWILSRSFLLLFAPVFTTVCTSFSLCLHSQKSSRIDSKCLGWSWCVSLLPSVWHAGLFADQCVCVRACEWMHCKPSVGVDYYVMAWCVTPNNSAIIFYISNNDWCSGSSFHDSDPCQCKMCILSHMDNDSSKRVLVSMPIALADRGSYYG